MPRPVCKQLQRNNSSARHDDADNALQKNATGADEASQVRWIR